MGHGKETPRQKMIGMMYLVLMAMLALNVSNEVLNAFAVLDEGLQSTIGTIEQTNDLVMVNFGSALQTNFKKTKKWYDLATEVKRRADSIAGFIEDRKNEMLDYAKEDTSLIFEHGHLKIENIKKKDNTDAPAVIMVGDANDKAGSDLKEKIIEYKEWIMADVLEESASEEVRNSIEASLETADGVDHKSGDKLDWSRAHFEHLPIAGVLSIMSAIQINVRNAEAEALKYLYNKIDEGTFKFTNLDATVIPNSNYIIKGNEYRASVFLAAFDTTATPVIYVAESKNPYDSTITDDEVTLYTKKPGLNYTKIKADHTGKAEYVFKGGSIGSRHWGGIIQVIGPSGDTISKPFKRSFMVAEGSAVVSPTKMNVFYVGVDNPVDVSVAGVQPEKVSIGISNGKSRKGKGDGSYIINPKRPGNSFVSVYANIEGDKKMIKRQEFRVKLVPDPVAKVAGKKSGGIAKNFLLAQVGVGAEMENFEFDLKFRVIEFTVSTTINGFLKEATSKSYKFSKAQKDLIRALNKGQKLYIEEIKAVGPDGQVRELQTIALSLTS